MDLTPWVPALVVCVVVLLSIIWTTNKRINDLRTHLDNLDRIKTSR